jgi:hypothetical protein
MDVLSVQNPRFYPGEVGVMGVLWHLVQVREDELNVIPVLHRHSVQLVGDNDFYG